MTPFRPATSIAAFVGDYENLGQPHNQWSPVYLSRLIWSDDVYMKHEPIKTIAVRAAGPRTLLVRALDAAGAEIRVTRFEEGKDFRLSGGTIQLGSNTSGVATGMYPMGPMALVSRETVTLGLDAEGHGERVTDKLTTGQ